MSYAGSTVGIMQLLCYIGSRQKGIILRQVLYEIYTVVTTIHFDKRRVYVRIYLVTVLFAYGTIIGPRNP